MSSWYTVLLAGGGELVWFGDYCLTDTGGLSALWPAGDLQKLLAPGTWKSLEPLHVTVRTPEDEWDDARVSLWGLLSFYGSLRYTEYSKGDRDRAWAAWLRTFMLLPGWWRTKLLLERGRELG